MQHIAVHCMIVSTTGTWSTVLFGDEVSELSAKAVSDRDFAGSDFEVSGEGSKVWPHTERESQSQSQRQRQRSSKGSSENRETRHYH